MPLSDTEFEEMPRKSRQEIKDYLYHTGHVLPLEGHQYLIGKTKGDRAVCLAWRDDASEGCLTDAIVHIAAQEIEQEGLLVPFLFLAAKSLYDEDFCVLGQIPYCFTGRRGLLGVLQGMNMKAQAHPLRLRS